MTAALTGFSLGLSLILAIGAQNAFVLRQGIQRAHVLAVVLTCALSDAVLIVVGVSGFGALSEAAPWIADVMRWAGAAFLIVYGAMSFRSAWAGTGALKAEGASTGSWKAAVLTCLALTWLNPHVYLDTVVLLGSVAAQYPGERVPFGIGAVCASFTFFFALGYGARLLAPLFARPAAWRVLDVVIGCIMWAIAAGLILKG
ncbi:LysE/ArgO family amino acid transporter [Flavimaricola marinus]|uniref:Arginine exporter protein ArgO n=1 Tax=Flavimaricola marinus TaxID=1819565 RepID=A0A238LG09_9RHOB|nr:LysE/ArgO family amino acid transporter [Flavimaricola marinus]SMY08548.1 Arginine exporter protein ArgO [Flavimaricola marinus]